MDNIDQDRIAELFADLTGLLEEASEFAAQSQASCRSLEAMKGSGYQLRAHLTACSAKLALIEHYMEVLGEN